MGAIFLEHPVDVNGTTSHSYLQTVTCHMVSHSVTFHPTQVNTPCLNSSQTGQYLIYLLPQTDGRLS